MKREPRMNQRYNYIENLRKYRRNRTRAREILKEELRKLADEGILGLTSEVHDIMDALGISITEVRTLLKTMINEKQFKTSDQEILKDVCESHGVEPGLIASLIKIEKESQLRSRHGVYDALESEIKKFVEQDED